MTRTLLITGSTDGIGFETARMLVQDGHNVAVHGRSESKLDATVERLVALGGTGTITRFQADLSTLVGVDTLADAVAAAHPQLDVLINNAGVFNAAEPGTADGLDVRFAVNTLAPYRLMRRLASRIGTAGRVVNLSSAAQAPVSPADVIASPHLGDGDAYARSKLALTMWSCHLGLASAAAGPVIVAVNPASLLGSKMVKDAFGIAGGDLSVGAEILVRAALDDSFADASGKYYDNDAKRFAPPHAHALDPARCEAIVKVMDDWLEAHSA